MKRDIYSKCHLYSPLIGFFSNSPSIKWTEPNGQYTQARLFINRNGSGSGTLSASASTHGLGLTENHHLIQVSASQSQQSPQTADLIAEFPLKYLDQKNWWRYCLPKTSKLNGTNTQTTSASEKDCNLDWFTKSHSSTNSGSTSYLLELMLKFLKLQHQLNLISLFHSSNASGSGNQSTSVTTLASSTGGDNNWLEKIKITCNLSNSSFKDSFLNYLFTSSTPISKNCLITPVKVNVYLNLGSESNQVATASTNSNNPYSLENLKKGTVTGNIEYSLTDYYGKLHDFDLNGGGARSKASISVNIKPNSKYEFKLSKDSSTETNDKLDFEGLYEKYQKRDLELKDFKCEQRKK